MERTEFVPFVANSAQGLDLTSGVAQRISVSGEGLVVTNLTYGVVYGKFGGSSVTASASDFTFCVLPQQARQVKLSSEVAAGYLSLFTLASGKVVTEAGTGVIAEEESPTAVFDFLMGGLPAGFVSSRASTGTFFGSDGVMRTAGVDEARIDHTPAGLPRGLLVEGSRTNQILWSNKPSTGGTWTGNNFFTANAAIGLDGAVSADSCDLPDVTELRVYDATAGAWVVQTPITVTSAKTLFSATYTVPVGCTSIRVYAMRNASGTPATHQTIGVTAGTVRTFSFYAWTAGGKLVVDGLQDELGPLSSSRIVTGAASVTRAADTISLATSLLKGWSSTANTVICTGEYEGVYTTSGQRLFEFSNGTSAERYGVGILTGGAFGAYSVIGGVASGSSPTMVASPAGGVRYKTGTGWTNGSIAAVANGGTVGTSTGNITASNSLLTIGGSGVGTFQAFGWIKSFGTLPVRTLNAELQGLSV